VNHFDFPTASAGRNTGELKTPDGFKGPYHFISENRAMLDSIELCHCWIDLVFGCKSRGEGAKDHLNIFGHLFMVWMINQVIVFVNG
jgi:hypothetical protein